jgi:hypothetical protein
MFTAPPDIQWMLDVMDEVAKPIRLAHRKRFNALSPIQPLKPIQRLGWLDDATTILCVKSTDGFRAGESYPVKTSNPIVERDATRLNIYGSLDDITLESSEFAVEITNDRGEPVVFMQAKFLRKHCSISLRNRPTHDFDVLLEHFEPPHVPSLSELQPDAYSKNLAILRLLQSKIRSRMDGFAFKPYQLEDLAMGALRDSILLGWDTGLGKTLGSYAWMLTKTGWRYKDGAMVPKEPVLIVALGDLHEQIATEAKAHFGIQTIGLATRGDAVRHAARNGLQPGFYITAYSTLAARPDLLEYLRVSITGAICDEATKMKGQRTQIGLAVRSLVPKYRAAVTANPIKNRLSDMFYLLWWVAGAKDAPHPEFPYGGDDLKDFSERYMVKEHNLTKERASDDWNRKFVRTTPEVASVHELWKITAELIVRRRKADLGDAIVKKLQHRITVPMGTHQQRIYRAHVSHRYVDHEGRPAIGKKLMALRQVAACPDAKNLLFHSEFDFTPKLLGVLKLINDILRRGEQVLVFSNFIATNAALSRRLLEASVPHLVIDGSLSPKERGAAAQRLKQGHPRIGLLSELSMAYGHSFSKINNVIRTSKDWAMDIDMQAEDRAYRVNSEKDVNVYDFSCEASVDETVANMLADKKQSNEMVLDGCLEAQGIQDEDLWELLTQTVEQFENAGEVSVDEEQLLATEWEPLKAQLREISACK